MELHQLRYFCAVAETNSFSRAAVQANVSQPSLSQQILKLEDELGARLFDRLGRSVRLTELGKTFLPRARAVLRELEAAKGDVDERKGSVGGLISIGVIPTIAPYLLPPHLTLFARQFPQAQLTVVEEITPVLLERLSASAVDIAVLALPVRGHEFEAFPLLTELSLPLCPKITNSPNAIRFRSKISAPNLSFYFGTATASGIPPLLPVIALASILKSFLRAVNSAASLPWWAPAWAFPSFLRWPSTNAGPAVTFALRITRPRELLALLSSADAPSLVFTGPFFLHLRGNGRPDALRRIR